MRRPDPLARLVPATHVFFPGLGSLQDVDARDEPGHGVVKARGMTDGAAAFSLWGLYTRAIETISTLPAYNER